MSNVPGRQPIPPSRRLQVLAPLAAVWLCVASLDLIVGIVIAGTSWNIPDLSMAERLSLGGYSAALLALVVGAIGSAALLGWRSVRGRAARRVAAGAGSVVIWVGTLLYGASWAAFWNAGVFLDRAAFTFWAPNPVQVFHWVYPPLAAGVVLVTTAGAIALTWWVPRRTARLSEQAKHRVVLAAGGLLCLCLVATAIGRLTYADGGTATLPGSPYLAARDQRTSPVARAAADAREALFSAETVLASSSGGAGRTIISMDEYVAGVDRARFRPLNVLMIQIESLRADQLRAYGSTRDVMPAVDALSREARVFTNAYVQATHSNYADLVPLASQYPLRSRQMHEYPENPTYPRVLIYDVLKALGHRTAVVSSQNERWGGMINFHRPSNLDYLFHAELYDGPTISPFEDAGFAEWVRQTRGAGSVDDRYTVDEAIRWLDTVGGAPFFLHMNLQSSHVPYVVPEGFDRPFGPDDIDFAIMWGRFPQDQVQVVKDRYADSLRYEDVQIGRLFAHLRAKGLWENTIIVIGGDNGEAFYEHGIAAHASTPYEEVVRVPMVVRAPGTAAAPDDRPAMFLDVPPSLLALMGLPPHPGFQGISLFDTNPDADRPIFTMVQSPLADQIAVIQSGRKLIHSTRDNGFILYDLVRDPGERRNIAAQRPDLVDELSAVLFAWRDRQLTYYADVSRHAREYAP
jgi:arylsulfatase A-like enzyme